MRRMRETNRALLLGCVWVIIFGLPAAARGQCCAGGSGSSRPAVPESPATARRTETGATPADRVLAIQGMTCSDCEKPLQKTLEGLPGVERASVQWPAGLARIWEAGEGVTLKEVEEAVADAGFKAEALRSTDLKLPVSAAKSVSSLLRKHLGETVGPLEITVRPRGQFAEVRVWSPESVSIDALVKALRDEGLRDEVLARAQPAASGEPRGRGR